MKDVVIEGVCSGCGEPAQTREGLICESCEGLHDQIAAARREMDESTAAERIERQKSLEFPGGSLDRIEHCWLAWSHDADIRLAWVKWKRARNALDAREEAYTAQLAAMMALVGAA